MAGTAEAEESRAGVTSCAAAAVSHLADGALHASDDKQMTYLDATMDEGVSRQRRRELEAKIEAAESRAMEQVKAEHTRAAPKYKEPLR